MNGKWWENKNLVRLLLIVFYPVGLYGFVKCRNKPKIIMTFMSVITGLALLLIVLGIINADFSQLGKDAVVKTESVQSDSSAETEIIVEKDNSESVPELSNTNGNPLIDQKLQTAKIINSAGNYIGDRAYIYISRIVFDKLTLENITDFYLTFKDKNYNWVTVFCDDGTGLFFGGGSPFVEFGKLDKIGIITEKSDWTMLYNDETKSFKRLNN